jgi:hypothetical protein
MTTKHRIAKAFALTAGMSLLSLQAWAGADAALYGPSAPKGSTFVRLYNAGNQPVAASVGNTQISEVAAQGSSDFSFMPQGDYSAKVGSQTVPVKLAGDHYYTLVNQRPAATGRGTAVQEQAEIPGTRAEPERPGPDPEDRRWQDRSGQAGGGQGARRARDQPGQGQPGAV